MSAQPVPAAQEIPRAPKHDFEDAVKAGQEFVLIDSRSLASYQPSHLDLKGALRVDPNNAAAQLDQVPRGKPIFVVCT
jgi:rhodanese-related sulfurtransferase